MDDETAEIIVRWALERGSMPSVEDMEALVEREIDATGVSSMDQSFVDDLVRGNNGRIIDAQQLLADLDLIPSETPDAWLRDVIGNGIRVMLTEREMLRVLETINVPIAKYWKIRARLVAQRAACARATEMLVRYS